MSATGGEVWVAAGTYKPTSGNNRAISFSMRNNVTIYGGFPADGTGTLANRQPASYTTILSGNVGNVNTAGDNSYHIINNPASLSLTSTAVLDGFVITGGNANGGNNDSNGAGIYNDGSNGIICSPTIRNCSFLNNRAGGGGAGILNIANGGISTPTITDCSFTSNTAVGGAGGIHNRAWNGGTSNPALTNCSFIDNTNSTGAVCNDGSNYSGPLGVCNPILTNCNFANNYTRGLGGGMCNFYSNPQLINCNFTRNFVSLGGMGGGIYNEYSSPFLVNCGFMENTALQSGGGLYSYGVDSKPILANCTFQGNAGAFYTGGGICNEGGSQLQLINCTLISNRSEDGTGWGIYNNSAVQLTNCVLWNNGGEKTFAGPTPPTVSYSLLQPDVYEYTYTDGSNNLVTSTSPFVSNTDLQLKAGSPAINAGSNLAYTAVNGPATDLAGNTRIQYGLIDMGAYESAFSHDLTPITYVSPSTQYGTSGFSVVIDAVELNSVASRGAFTVRITKDAKAVLSFSPDVTLIGGKTVQNSVWTFSSADPNYYVLRTTQSVAASDRLSVGLTGTLNPGATGGILAVSSTLLSEGVVETKLTNNVDADKVEYFQQ
ncbi:choice-of-anchor Q domain-containing protein [Spirosoma validum]|uniref:Right-handed parallel beta-helix repeat-containing protein n=1 Tax=Spirosoma validum TaxID=2771355 RepID=A0A927AZB2_9BACT|nr:choice-of-anchor Q domain-containing protein [Spirosoma validum]MBD2752534.1 hypothetical protein [Spirosoma validum]